MRGINYLAGFGTVLIFIGIYCFRALNRKDVVKGYIQNPKVISKTNKVIILISGIVSFVLGLILIIKSLKLI